MSRHTLQPEMGAMSVVFTPNGGEVATGGTEGSIDFWNAETGAHRKTLKAHSWRIRSLVFSSDGKTLVSGSEDGTVLLWDFPR